MCLLHPSYSAERKGHKNSFGNLWKCGPYFRTQRGNIKNFLSGVAEPHPKTTKALSLSKIRLIIREVKIKNKKGIQLNEAFGAILTLVLVATLVIIGVYMFTSLGSTFTGNAVSIINETGTVNGSGYVLANSTVCNFASPSITQVLSSGGVLVPSANYTLTGSRVTNATATTYTNALISYSYTWGGQACVTSGSIVTNFTSYPALVGLVGVIILLGIIIGVLVSSFVFGGKKGA